MKDTKPITYATPMKRKDVAAELFVSEILYENLQFPAASVKKSSRSLGQADQWSR